MATAKTARLSDDGKPLPEDFSPSASGSRSRSMRTAKRTSARRSARGRRLCARRLRIAHPLVVLDNLALPQSGSLIAPDVIYALDSIQAPWASETDGFEEISTGDAARRDRRRSRRRRV